MRKIFASLLASSLLLAPVSAFAQFTDVSALWQEATSTGKPRAFSFEVHGRSGPTYFALWSNGAQEGMDATSMKMRVHGTLDVVQGAMKLRAKFQAMIHRGTAYVKLESLDGTYEDEIARLAATVSQKTWLAMPLDEADLAHWNNMMTGRDMDAGLAAQLLMMSHTRAPHGFTYELKLQPEAAVEFARSFTGMLMEEQPIPTDLLLPGDMDQGNADFSMKVDTNSANQFLFSRYHLGWNGGDTEMTVDGTTQRQMTPVYIETPKGALDSEAFLSMLMQGMGSFGMDPMSTMMDDEPLMDDEPMLDTSVTPDFNTVEEEYEATPVFSGTCFDPSLSAGELLQLQRMGECPLEFRHSQGHYGR